MALLLKKAILPLWPETHAGHGLLMNNAIVLHNMALEIAQRIHAMGGRSGTYTRKERLPMSVCSPCYLGFFAREFLPSVASRIYGVTDAVVDGLTGLLHPPGDVDAIVQQLSALLSKPKCRLDMGIRSRQYALRYFSQKDVSKESISFYEALVVLKPHSIIR